MVLNHQTFSPATCKCVIEEQFETDELGNNGPASLWFFHHVCERHEPLVKNKKKLSLKAWHKNKDAIIMHQEFLLQHNRERHLKDFDEHPLRKTIKERLKDMMMSAISERYALTLEAKMEADRLSQVAFLDNHDSESMERLVLGVHSPYALIAQEVYDAIKEEQKQPQPDG